jgi:hypothetical protein
VESRKGHVAFTYRLNQITEDSDSFRDHVVNECYNIASVLRWQLKDATAITLERANCNTATHQNSWGRYWKAKPEDAQLQSSEMMFWSRLW